MPRRKSGLPNGEPQPVSRKAPRGVTLTVSGEEVGKLINNTQSSRTVVVNHLQAQMPALIRRAERELLREAAEVMKTEAEDRLARHQEILRQLEGDAEPAG